MSEIICSIEKIKSLTPAVQQVILRPDNPFDFHPGQYIQVVMGKDDKRPFSIANAPDTEGYIELHIGATPDNAYAWEVLQLIEGQSECRIDGPHGKAYLRPAQHKPTILLAGGTGFSYVSSILHSLVNNNGEQDIHLYWGTRTEADMYAMQEMQALASLHRHFVFHPVIEHPEKAWQGKSGWVHQAVLDDFDDLSPFRVFVAGRFEMASAVRDSFQAKGLLPDNLFGDAYAFI